MAFGLPTSSAAPMARALRRRSGERGSCGARPNTQHHQLAIPVALTDHPSAPFSLEVQLNADDYRRYFAIAGKRESGFSNAMIFVVALFLAIAVAFLFRALASLETQSPAAIELVGRYSLFAYLVGVLVYLMVGSIMRRRSIGRILAGTPHAFDSKTIVLDTDAVSITGKLSE